MTALYAEQMAEVEKVDEIIAGLVDDLNECPATVRGYRAADEIRPSLSMWQEMRARMLANAIAMAAGTDETA